MKNKFLLITLAIVFISINLQAQLTGTYTDSRDGKVYKTVKIGTQTWMAQNLAYKASSGCWAYNNDKSNVATYGYLYDWETAKKSCPAGWHFPSDDEWTTLITFLGGEGATGGEIKEPGTTHWDSPNSYATNISGFTALPGGYRDGNGVFIGIGYIGYWWISTEVGKDEAWYKSVNSDESTLAKDTEKKIFGFSVRCIKD